MRGGGSRSDRGQEIGAQKDGEPSEEKAEVESGGGEDGVDAIAVLAREIVAAHPVLGLDVTDDRLDRGASSHLAFDGGGGSSDLAGDKDAEAVRVVVAAIAFIDVDAPNLEARVLLDVGDSGPERMAVEGIAVKRLGVQDELTAFGLGDGGGDRDLAAELIGRPRLALADAFDLGRVQGVDLRPSLALVLEADPDGQ